MKPYAEKFYKSKTWQKTREEYSRSKLYLCEDCLAKGIHTTGEIVHHIQPITEKTVDNPAITLGWDNLRLLCRSCHERVHRRRKTRYRIDEQGRIVINETER